VEAPSKEAAEAVHREAHGLVVDEIVEVQEGCRSGCSASTNARRAARIATPEKGNLMHAVLVAVNIKDFESARNELEQRVVPGVSQAPGFVAGYWLEPQGNMGYSIVVFDSEDAARTAADRLEPPSDVEIERVDVREVVAHA
jgi:hypothetical protein